MPGGAAQERPNGRIGGIGGITIGDGLMVRGSRITVGALTVMAPLGMVRGRGTEALTPGIGATGPTGTDTLGKVTPIRPPDVGSG